MNEGSDNHRVVPFRSRKGKKSDEHARVLDGQRMAFSARFVMPDGLAEERSLTAHYASAAIQEGLALAWPVGAGAMRIVDLDGREVYEQIKGDR